MSTQTSPRPRIKCGHCEITFVPRRADVRFCSRTCGGLRSAIEVAERNIEDLYQPKVCAVCHETYQPKASRTVTCGTRECRMLRAAEKALAYDDKRRERYAARKAAGENFDPVKFWQEAPDSSRHIRPDRMRLNRIVEAEKLKAMVAPPAKATVTQAAPCATCRHGKAQPASDTGWECLRMVARACNPLGVAPKFYEVKA